MQDILELALYQLARIAQSGEIANNSISDDVSKIFYEFENKESPQFGERAKRGHDAWDKFNDQNAPIYEENDSLEPTT